MATTIQNGRGLHTFSQYPEELEPGVPQGDGQDHSYENALLPQVSTCTWSAAADVSDEIVAGQVIRTTLTDPDGVAYVNDYTVTADDNTAGTDGAGLALMATRQAASLEADSDLMNIISASASGAVCTVTWLHPDPRGNWTFAATVVQAAAETTLVTTEATSQDTGGAVVPMARFVARATPSGGGKRRCTLPQNASAVLAGISLRDMSVARGTSLLSAATNDYPIGSMVAVREQGGVPMVNVGDATAQAGDPVYVVVSTTGGDALGEARSDRDGTADVWTATPTAANATVYALQIHFPAWDGEDAVTILVPPVTSDGSGTATEICDALRVNINAISALTDLLTASGTTTLVLTGDTLGRPFIVTDAAEAGEWASITHTTTAAQYTMRADRARWREVTPAESVGTVYLNF